VAGVAENAFTENGLNVNIPFNKPFIAGSELDHIARAVQTGNISGDGPFTKQCSRMLEERFGIHRVLLTPSCTAALELAAMLCNLGSGDEVIVPSFTFVSTVNAFVRSGAKPVFVDIDPETLNMNAKLVHSAVTQRTKAIFPVHYAGISCEMDSLMSTANEYGLMVVEDAAQGVNAWYHNRALGSIGHLGCYSFHETKNYTCGEGGALCINDPALVARAEILRDKGTNRQQYFRGEVDKYTWVDVGSSYVPSEICSAFLLGQLELMDAITSRRREIHEFYLERLKPLESAGCLRLACYPSHCTSNFHLFYVLLPDRAARNGLMDDLKSQGIQAAFHYVPLHTSPMGLAYGYQEGDLPVTEDLSGRLLRLPFYHDITEREQQRVVDGIEKYCRVMNVESVFAAAAKS
jgi:dTDP-4-amino-4,6-dideoxygalactose transaminase